MQTIGSWFQQSSSDVLYTPVSTEIDKSYRVIEGSICHLVRKLQGLVRVLLTAAATLNAENVHKFGLPSGNSCLSSLMIDSAAARHVLRVSSNFSSVKLISKNLL
jgi:hypothetical protein